MKKKIILALGTCAIVGASIGATYAASPTDCTSIDRTAVEQAMEKQRAGTTLSDSEAALLVSAKECRSQMRERFGSGRLDESGSGRLEGGRMHREFGSGATMSGATMRPEMNLTDAEKTSLTTMTDAEKKAFFESKRATMGSGTTAPRERTGEQNSAKSAYRAKISQSYATTVDTLMTKYMNSLASKTTVEKIAAIDAMIAKISTVETTVQSSSSYSDAVKAKYANIFGYLKQSFVDRKASLSSGTDDASLIDSLLQ